MGANWQAGRRELPVAIVPNSLAAFPDMSGYRCPYCLREKLIRARMAWHEYLWLILLMRVWRCPHCFERFRRPII